MPRSQVDVYVLGQDVNDNALARATSALHCAASSPAPHSDVALDDASLHCGKQLEPDKQEVAGHVMALMLSEHVRVAASTEQLAVGTVPLRYVPLMVIDVSPVRPLTSGKLPASGVLLMAKLRMLAGKAPSAVKPAPLTSSVCTAGSEGSVPASRPVSCSIRLVSAGKLHTDGAVTDPSPRSDRL